MPVQRKDLDTQWTLMQSGQTYVLARQATIRVDANYGIYEGSNNNDIIVNGDILARAGAQAAIRIASSSSTLTIGEDALLRGARENGGNFLPDGIVADGAGQKIVNHGQIDMRGAGIYGALWGEVENHGSITGFAGIAFEDAGATVTNSGKILSVRGVVVEANRAMVVNERDGVINGAVEGVALLGADGGGELVNRGTIRSENTAIVNESSEISIVNHGRIIGDVYLGGGHDFFEMKGGTVKGRIDGGAGDDVYRVHSFDLHIIDTGSSVADLLYANVSYTLGRGVDWLQLTSGRNIDGTGNADANSLFGNEGDNMLRGLEGDDILSGAGGRDTLTGGAGEDEFEISRGFGFDTITDFEDDADLLFGNHVLSQEQFDALVITRKGDDTLIDFGGGDRLLLRSILPEAISYDDFLHV